MKVLIVEDRNENVFAAMEFFRGKSEVEVRGNAETALRAFREEVFFAAIIDMEIPRNKGGKSEKLGAEIGKVAKETGTPYVFLTGGYFHHGPQAKVFLDEVCLEEDEGEVVPDKSCPQAWAKAWEILQSLGNLQENYNARLRYKEYTGKIYERR